MEEFRLECLKLAASIAPDCVDAAYIIAEAEKLLQFVMGRPDKTDAQLFEDAMKGRQPQ